MKLCFLLEMFDAQENKRMIPANDFSFMAEHMPLGTAVVDNSLFISIFPMLGAMRYVLIWFRLLRASRQLESPSSRERAQETGKYLNSPLLSKQMKVYFCRGITHISAELLREIYSVFLVCYIKHKQSKAESKFTSVMVFYNVFQLFPDLTDFFLSLSYVCCI